MSRIREANLIRRAIKERWPIPKAVRGRLAKRLQEILEESKDARSVVAAARALLTADKINQEQEKRDLNLPDRRVEVSGAVRVEHEVAEYRDAFLALASGLLGTGDGPVPVDRVEQPVDPPPADRQAGPLPGLPGP